MAAAIALAVVLIIAVAGMSLAMQTQRPVHGQQAPRPQRPPRTPPITPRRVRERRPPTPPPAPAPPTFDPPSGAAASASPKVPELLRTGTPAAAKVVNVVDERVVGPVTRSRLTLRIRPDDGDEFEVSIRHAFPTAEERGRVRVGGTVAVRYDRDDHNKVVLDPDGPADGAGSADRGSADPGSTGAASGPGDRRRPAAPGSGDPAAGDPAAGDPAAGGSGGDGGRGGAGAGGPTGTSGPGRSEDGPAPGTGGSGGLPTS